MNKVSDKLQALIKSTKDNNQKFQDLYIKLSTLNGGKKQWSNFDFPSIGKMLALLEMLRVEKAEVVIEFFPLEYMDVYNQLRYSFSYVKDGRINKGNPSPDWEMLREYIKMMYEHFDIPFTSAIAAPLNQETWQQKERYYASVVDKSLSANIQVIVSDE